MSDEKNNEADDGSAKPGTDGADSVNREREQDSAEPAAAEQTPRPEQKPAAQPDSEPQPKGSPLVSKPIPTATPKQEAPVKKGSSFIAWLALLLVLVLAGAAGWTVQQGLQREAGLQDRISSLEGAAGSEKADLAAAQKQWRQQLNKGLNESRDAVAAQEKALAEMRSQILAQAERLASYSANDHESWLRAEAQYLLRLANQRLIMARDVESALALLGSADSILVELDDATLYEVRAALKAEQAALRAVPRVDVEGIYLRLSALVEQADNLVIFELPEQAPQPEAEAADDWQTRLERGYEEAARKLSDYIVIRRRDVPMHALMDPQWEGLVRQNLRMLLEQAQVALLSGNQTLYTESLQRSQHWVAQFFDSDEAASRAMSREIGQLEQQTVQVVMPDLTRSLKALDTAMKKHLQQGGAE